MIDADKFVYDAMATCAACGQPLLEDPPAQQQADSVRDALKSLFQWCEDTVPYFGENWRGSRADIVYRRAAKALGEELNDPKPEPGSPV